MESAESSGRSKPTRTHRQLGKAGAFTLCSPPLPSQISQGSNSQGRLQAKKYVILHDGCCSADYPSSPDQTSLLWTTTFSRLQAEWSEKNHKEKQPLVHRHRGRKQIFESPSHPKQGTSCCQSGFPSSCLKTAPFCNLRCKIRGCCSLSSSSSRLHQAPAHPQPSLLGQDDRSK